MLRIVTARAPCGDQQRMPQSRRRASSMRTRSDGRSRVQPFDVVETIEARSRGHAQPGPLGQALAENSADGPAHDQAASPITRRRAVPSPRAPAAQTRASRVGRARVAHPNAVTLLVLTSIVRRLSHRHSPRVHGSSALRTDPLDGSQTNAHDYDVTRRVHPLAVRKSPLDIRVWVSERYGDVEPRFIDWLNLRYRALGRARLLLGRGISREPYCVQHTVVGSSSKQDFGLLWQRAGSPKGCTPSGGEATGTLQPTGQTKICCTR